MSKKLKYYFAVLFPVLFALFLIFVPFGDYKEAEGIAVVTDTGQCTRYRCSYTATYQNSVTFILASSNPKSIGQQLPIRVRTYKDGRIEYFFDRK